MRVAVMEGFAGIARPVPQELAKRLLGLGDAAYRMSVHALGAADAAEDVVQQAYLEAWAQLRAGFVPEDLRPWFLKVVKNIAWKHLRGEARRARREAAVGVAGKTAGPAGQDEGLVLALREAMGRLEREYRLPLALLYEEGLSQQETAAVLDLPETTLRRRLDRGVELLRKALARAGYAAAPAAVMAGLAHTSPPVPPTLVAAIEGLVSGEAMIGEAGATADPVAVKGGLAMKIVAGVVLAGALAGGAALLSPGGRGGPPSPPATPPDAGQTKHEHVASVNTYSYHGDDIDGPAREATGFRGGAPDVEGNLWGARWLRVSDGRILRVNTCDHGSLGLNLPEGPIAGRPVKYEAGGYGWPCGGSAMMGRPDADGKTDGIYEAVGREGQLIRIWKNKEKGGRWWFARAAGGGAAAAPKAKGQSADALTVKFGWLNQPQVGLDGKLRFLADNAFYLLEDGKVTCVLGPDDYKAATEAMKGALPNQGYVGGDGTFYLGYYYASKDAFGGRAPAIWRATPDGKVEPYAQNNGGLDGDALKEAGWFCGPHLGQCSVARFIPPDALLTTAHDEDFVRRIQKGRVAVLLANGEWKEYGAGDKRGKGAGIVSPELLNGCGLVIGPNGAAYHTSRDWLDQRLWRYTGIDFGKPAVNKRAGDKP